MKSLTYTEELDTALVQTMTDDEASAHASALYPDDRIRRLIHDLEMPLSEGVRLYVGIYCRRPSDADHFAAFLESLRFLRSEVENNNALCAAYVGVHTEDRATPLLAANEIANIILLAIATGAATQIGVAIVDVFLGKINVRKKSEALMNMLLASPIPSLLAQEGSGLTADEIAAKTGLSAEHVICFLERYEKRGWLEREETAGEDAWTVQRDNINRFFGL